MRSFHKLLVAHSPDYLATMRTPSASDPLRVLLSGCLVGWKCGVDKTDYGLGDALAWLTSLAAVKCVAFCPEEHALGSPRNMPDIHGGDGFDVLDRDARVLDQHGNDVTEAMLKGAEAMLDFALMKEIEIAVLTDMSAACGSQVVSDGCRLVKNRKYRAGPGVAAACLLRANIPVIAQRDHKTLGLLRQKLDPGFVSPPDLRDHHEKQWYQSYFTTPEDRPFEDGNRS